MVDVDDCLAAGSGGFCKWAGVSDLPQRAIQLWWIAAGVNVKAIQVRMGHTSITTTMNTYGHLLPSAFQDVPEKLEALL